MQYQEGVYKVVEAPEVEKHTAEGWRIVEVLKETKTETAYGLEKHPCPGTNYDKEGRCWTNPETISVGTPMLIIVVKFLLWQDKSSELAKAAQAVRTAHETVSLCEAEHKKLEAAKVRAEQDLSSAKRDNEALERMNLELSKARGQLADINAKLEEHVAKLREEVGAKRARELLDG